MSDEELVNEVLAATSRLSTREAAAALKVSHGTVAGWRGGERPSLYPATRRKLEDYLEGLESGPGLVRETARPYGKPTEPGEDEQAANDLFRSMDNFARFLGGIQAPTPEQTQLRKLDAMEGYRRMITGAGKTLPAWWHELRRRIEEEGREADIAPPYPLDRHPLKPVLPPKPPGEGQGGASEAS